MSFRRRVVFALLTVALLPWLGMLRAVPHNHADTMVPQEALSCSASRVTSFEIHLHSAGERLTPHPCVACLAGTVHAAAPFPTTRCGAEPTSARTADLPHDLRSRNHMRLPLSRGPPAAV